MPDDALLTTLMQIRTAESLSQVREAICKACAPLGYDRVILFSASARHDMFVDRIYWVEGDWFEDGSAVDAETYLLRCPITRHVLTVREPFFWIKTVDLGYRVVRRPASAGMKGFQVPVYGPIGLEGAVSFGGVRINTGPAAQIILSLLATEAFRVSRALLEGPAADLPQTLSTREAEVLGWIASGRRHGEIALTLGISDRTVENHLRNIRKRLAVTTTAQAVQAAIRLGVLNPDLLPRNPTVPGTMT